MVIFLYSSLHTLAWYCIILEIIRGDSALDSSILSDQENPIDSSPSLLQTFAAFSAVLTNALKPICDEVFICSELMLVSTVRWGGGGSSERHLCFARPSVFTVPSRGVSQKIFMTNDNNDINIRSQAQDSRPNKVSVFVHERYRGTRHRFGRRRHIVPR